MGTGYKNTRNTWNSENPKRQNPEQRIDAFALNCWPSRSFMRIAYEVKVSRSDFLHEIKHPEKRTQALVLSNEFYFAVPEGLVKVEEVPDDCGLLYVKDDLTTRIVKAPPWRKGAEFPLQFVASLLRNASRVEHELRRLREYHRKMSDELYALKYPKPKEGNNPAEWRTAREGHPLPPNR